MDFKIHTAIPYYLHSLVTLLGFENYLLLPLISVLLVMDRKTPRLVSLKNSSQFLIGHPMDIWAIKEVVLDDDYRLKQITTNLDVVVDIGAGVGDFSIMVSKLAKTVLAFEADDYRCELLIKNIKLNKKSNIIPYKVTVESLDQFFELSNVSTLNCDFLKIDCEGNEYEIMRQSSDHIISRNRFIAFEVHFFNQDHVKSYQELLKRLRRIGFSYKEVPNRVHTNIAFLFAWLN